MRSPENGQSRKGAAFLRKDSSNLPHPVRTPSVETTMSLITRITGPTPPCSSLSCSPHITFSPLFLQPGTPPPGLLLLFLTIGVGVKMNGLCGRLQAVEEWTPNKVIKAARVTLNLFAAVILMDRGIIMTPRPLPG